MAKMVTTNVMTYDSEGGRFPPTLDALKKAINDQQRLIHKLEAGGNSTRIAHFWLSALRGHLKRQTKKEA